MFQKLNLLLLSLLLALLPHHGFLTTIMPEWFRFWKEAVLGLLLLFNITNIREQISENRKNPFTIHHSPSTFLILFLVYGAILVLTSQDPSTALVAFRYISTGYIAYLIFSLTNVSSLARQRVSSLFIISCVLSVLFGLWAKYLGGYEILANLYSNTISSWVPGQTLPLYHEANGIIRMQGGASGPVAFGHMLLAGLFLILFRSDNRYQISDIRKKLFTIHHSPFTFLIFLIGIYQSYSRAAMLAAVVLLLIYAAQRTKNQIPNLKQIQNPKSKILVCCLLSTGLLAYCSLLTDHCSLSRAGTSQHFTRPMQAIRDGLEHPITGNLGSYGPAARGKNLREHNNDQAPIAENVLADTFVQTGLIGLVLILGFWIILWRQSNFNTRIWIITIFLTTSLATLFDMIPLAIIYFWVLRATELDNRTT